MTKRNGGRVIRVMLAAASTVRRAGLEALLKKAPLLDPARLRAAIEEHAETLGARIDPLLLRELGSPDGKNRGANRLSAVGCAATSSRKFQRGGSHPEISRNQPISGNYRLE